MQACRNLTYFWNVPSGSGILSPARGPTASRCDAWRGPAGASRSLRLGRRSSWGDAGAGLGRSGYALSGPPCRSRMPLDSAASRPGCAAESVTAGTLPPRRSPSATRVACSARALRDSVLSVQQPALRQPSEVRETSAALRHGRARTAITDRIEEVERGAS
jgi:hypothetical protein